MKAFLLIGPTGAGKTPLGDLLAQRGIFGQRCVHFDFGEELRKVARGYAQPSSFTQNEVQFIKAVLESGALLEDEQLPLALKILRCFLKREQARADDLVILNGLPRHAG